MAPEPKYYTLSLHDALPISLSRQCRRIGLEPLEDAGAYEWLDPCVEQRCDERHAVGDRKSTRLNSRHGYISYAVLCMQKKNGYGIGIRIEQISNGVFQVNAGSLFPALRRLERAGLLNSVWRQSPSTTLFPYTTLFRSP